MGWKLYFGVNEVFDVMVHDILPDSADESLDGSAHDALIDSENESLEAPEHCPLPGCLDGFPVLALHYLSHPEELVALAE